MTNVKMSVKGSILTIEVDLSAEGRLSETGKSTVLGTSHGNQKLEDPRFPGVKVGVNVFKLVDKPAK